jgi:hypothetical protein
MVEMFDTLVFHAQHRLHASDNKPDTITCKVASQPTCIFLFCLPHRVYTTNLFLVTLHREHPKSPPNWGTNLDWKDTSDPHPLTDIPTFPHTHVHTRTPAHTQTHTTVRNHTTTQPSNHAVTQTHTTTQPHVHTCTCTHAHMHTRTCKRPEHGCAHTRMRLNQQENPTGTVPP